MFRSGGERAAVKLLEKFNQSKQNSTRFSLKVDCTLFKKGDIQKMSSGVKLADG